MGEPLLRGREFTDRDRTSSEPVVIVNQALARRYFPNTDPIGQRIALNDPSEGNPWRVIVGVVADESAPAARPCGLGRDAHGAQALAQDPPRSASLLRAAQEPTAARGGRNRRTGRLGAVEPMDSRLSKLLGYPRLRAAASVLSPFSRCYWLRSDCTACLGCSLYSVRRRSVSAWRWGRGPRM